MLKITADPGNRSFIARVAAMPKAIRKDLEMVVNRFALDVLRDSKTVPPMVPVDTGALMSTGRAEPANFEAGKWSASIVYGGIGVDYAEIVHEDMRAKNFHRPGSGPKFVEAHFIQRASELERAINNIMTSEGQK
jgi:hypothetical protein